MNNTRNCLRWLAILILSFAVSNLPGSAAAASVVFVGAPEPAKIVPTGPLSAAEERATFTLAPGFEIELVAQESEGIGKFVAIDFDLQGRMWSMTALEYPVDANENPAVAKALYESRARDKVLVWDKPYGRGPHEPRVFADGLAIPLGILPYKNGVYVQHGPDIAFLSDNDGDGKADKRTVVLTGFGVQDSHLFPHQFTRAPGNWIWFAQGAFNSGKVKTTRGAEQQFDRTRMARFRYDGSEFDITSQGPCNIWGLVLDKEGECFIQEANDYGYPVMPFHRYANYPGCSDALFKSYAPEFPGTAPEFRMGGTGLSGLALSDVEGAWPAPYADVMYVANPITRTVQAIKIHREGPRYRLEKLADFIQSSDPMFRPVALRIGPDGCLYIVDWYNKIISHNEVPRNHPERDKKRGRIWRVKHKEQTSVPVPNFLTLPGNELLAKLGGSSTPQSHFAWQSITDRQLFELVPALKSIVRNSSEKAGRRIASLWALEGLHDVDLDVIAALIRDGNRNARREAVRALGESSVPPARILTAIGPLADDPDPEVRAEVIRTAGPLVSKDARAVALCVKMARTSLAEPTMKSTANGRTIKAGAAYEREFERYLIRLYLEQQPQAVMTFLDSAAAEPLPVENRLLAALAIEPRASAGRVAQLLPQLGRLPSDEEVLRLGEFPDAPGVAEALKRLLQAGHSSSSTVEALIKGQTRLDKSRLEPILSETAAALWNRGADGRGEALRLATVFKLQSLEERINSGFQGEPALSDANALAALRALREIGSGNPGTTMTFATFVKSPRREIGEEAVMGLAAARNDKAPGLLFKVWDDLSPAQRRLALNILSSSKAGAASLVNAIRSSAVPQADIDGATFDKMHAVLGDDPVFVQWMESVSTLFQPALRLDGKDTSYVDTKLTLEGPFTVETWVKLDEGIGNGDGILGGPGSADFNFFDSTFRVHCGAAVGDRAIAHKKMTANAWTHLAVTRDAAGVLRLYINGEIDNTDTRSVTNTFRNLDIGRTIAATGTAGWLTEFRVWNVARTADEIRVGCDQSLDGSAKPAALVYYSPGAGPWGKLHGNAKVMKTADFPHLLTASEAKAQGEKFAVYRALATKDGNVERGRALFSSICMNCHTVSGQGAQVGPVLNGAGASGIESLLRNILTPNAAMEAGYRIFRTELKDGDVIDGILVSQDKDGIVIRRPNTPDARIKQSEIRRADFVSRSMMPEGLLEGLKSDEVTDLFSYLKTLK